MRAKSLAGMILKLKSGAINKVTTYSHNVTFNDSERIWIESIAKEAIEKFKLEHADDGLPVPWVWESILERFKQADIQLMSRADNSVLNPIINIRTSDNK